MAHAAAAVVLSLGLVAGVASPSLAATKHSTAVKLSGITHVATASNPGSRIVSGDKVKLTGSTSTNLVGRVVRVQLKQGARWIDYTGSAKVSKAKTFSIVSRAANVGKQHYRVAFAGTSTLKSSSSSKAATVWKWFPLVDQRVASKVEPLGWDYPHLYNQMSVAGRNYSHLLAGHSSGETSSADFNLGYHCSVFTTIVGLGDSSTSGTTGTFTVYLDGNQAAQQANLPVGKTATVVLDASGIFRIRLEHDGFVPKPGGGAGVSPAWPTARVLCSSNLGA